MSYNIKLDLELCQGYANCLIEAPSLFDIDEETDKAILLNSEPPDDLRQQAEAAQRGCPAKAIWVEEK